jgi:hypothetical protein
MAREAHQQNPVEDGGWRPEKAVRAARRGVAGLGSCSVARVDDESLLSLIVFHSNFAWAYLGLLWPWPET